jgi:hypothetical protein
VLVEHDEVLKVGIAIRAGWASTSSCIDRLGGESRACARNVLPAIRASALAPIGIAINSPAALASKL